MKVVDFDFSEFRDYLCVSVFPYLNGRILVVGVAEGGVPIADFVADEFRRFGRCEISRADVVCQRPSTKVKKGANYLGVVMRCFIKLLPRFALNGLRVLEHQYLSRRKLSSIERVVSLRNGVVEGNYSAVLIVDDAVDSGASVKAVSEYLSGNYLVDISRQKILAVVCTQDAPLVKPDFFMASNVLFRFPWSLDAR